MSALKRQAPNNQWDLRIVTTVHGRYVASNRTYVDVERRTGRGVEFLQRSEQSEVLCAAPARGAVRIQRPQSADADSRHPVAAETVSLNSYIEANGSSAPSSGWQQSGRRKA